MTIERVRYRLTLAYDGAAFSGWQKQEPPDPDAPPDETGERPRTPLRTVQHVVEQAVRATVRDASVNLLGASRTDAGVHAAGQVGAFTTTVDDAKGIGWPRERGCEALVRALNSRLPEDVLVIDAAEAPEGFDPITHAVRKRYTYRVHSSKTRPLWDRGYVTWTWHELDLERMRAAAAHIVGERDFAAFAQINHGRKTTVRTVFACDVATEPAEPNADRFVFGVKGSSFLYNMVRIIVGTLVEVGRGKIEPDDVPAIIASTDRRNAGPTMAPEGLRLEWIRYPGEGEEPVASAPG